MQKKKTKKTKKNSQISFTFENKLLNVAHKLLSKNTEVNLIEIRSNNTTQTETWSISYTWNVKTFTFSILIKSITCNAVPYLLTSNKLHKLHSLRFIKGYVS